MASFVHRFARGIRRLRLNRWTPVWFMLFWLPAGFVVNAMVTFAVIVASQVEGPYRPIDGINSVEFWTDPEAGTMFTDPPADWWTPTIHRTTTFGYRRLRIRQLEIPLFSPLQWATSQHPLCRNSLTPSIPSRLSGRIGLARYERTARQLKTLQSQLRNRLDSQVVEPSLIPPRPWDPHAYAAGPAFRNPWISPDEALKFAKYVQPANQVWSIARVETSFVVESYGWPCRWVAKCDRFVIMEPDEIDDWPAGGYCGGVFYDVPPILDPSLDNDTTDRILLADVHPLVSRIPWSGYLQSVIIPTRIHFIPLILNTIVIALGLRWLWLWPRRLLRIRRGRCEVCGYDVWSSRFIDPAGWRALHPDTRTPQAAIAVPSSPSPPDAAEHRRPLQRCPECGECVRPDGWLVTLLRLGLTVEMPSPDQSAPAAGRLVRQAWLRRLQRVGLVVGIGAIAIVIIELLRWHG